MILLYLQFIISAQINGQEVKQISCEPNAVFKYDCKKCQCNASGESAECIIDHCDSTEDVWMPSRHTGGIKIHSKLIKKLLVFLHNYLFFAFRLGRFWSKGC